MIIVIGEFHGDGIRQYKCNGNFMVVSGNQRFINHGDQPFGSWTQPCLMKRDWELLEFNGGFELGNPPEIATPQKRQNL